MFATTKASRIGFFGIVVAMVATLGGCAESVQTPGVTAVDHKNPFMATRILPRPIKDGEDQLQVRKVEESRTARVDAKHAAHIAADVR